MSIGSIFQALEPLVRAFDALGIRYLIGGSIASSAYGIARATLDVVSGHPVFWDGVQNLVEAPVKRDPASAVDEGPDESFPGYPQAAGCLRSAAPGWALRL